MEHKAHREFKVYKSPRGFNGTDGVNGTQGLPGPSQILKSNIYINSTFTTTQGLGPTSNLVSQIQQLVTMEIHY